MSTSVCQFDGHPSLDKRYNGCWAADRHFPIMVDWSVGGLRPHPRYVELCGPVAEPTLFEMANLGDRLWEEPLVVTDSGIILDGYKRWLLAHQQKGTHVLCIQHSLESDKDVLSFLVDLQLRKPKVQNDFQRILLALELEFMLRAMARERQQTGGRDKGSSNLTTDARVDVRSEMARRAKVSAGNVTKVKQVLARGCPDLLAALKSGHISIHRAHHWSKLPQVRQRRSLLEWRDAKDIKSSITRLLKKHSRSDSPRPLTIPRLAQLLMSVSLITGEVPVEIIKCQGQRIFISEELSLALQELSEDPDPKSRGN
jgi:hypothetical protein